MMKMPRATTWRMTSTFCSLAETSVPTTQIHVMTRIRITAPMVTAALDSASPSSPKVRKPNCTPTSASEPITRTPVIVMAHPPSQPNHGPMARVTHENVVPQSWSALLRK